MKATRGQAGPSVAEGPRVSWPKTRSDSQPGEAPKHLGKVHEELCLVAASV
jgi:hypothetical protein